MLRRHFIPTGNSQCPVGYCQTDSVFTHRLHGAVFWANPPWDPDFIFRLLEHMLSCFAEDPIHTTFFLVIPHQPRAKHWHMTTHFQLIHQYPRGTEKLFSRPTDGTHHTDDLEPSGSEGGENRVFISGCPHEVCVFFKDCNTRTVLDSAVQLHCAFGHYSRAYLLSLFDKGARFAWPDITRRAINSANPPGACAVCLEADCRKPLLSARTTGSKPSIRSQPDEYTQPWSLI